jgi:Fur family peroxide stress response transcriptional regulator
MNKVSYSKRMEDIFYRRARENGIKVTPQRTAIYLELAGAKDHPSADMIYRKLIKKIPNISFDTINRTLLTFAEIGIADIVEGCGQPKRYDPDISAHHHFRCIRCNNIVDFCNKAYDDISVPREIQDQFTVLHKRVVLEGLCNRCKKKSERSRTWKNRRIHV